MSDKPEPLTDAHAGTQTRKRFPIRRDNRHRGRVRVPISIPWSALAPHEAQAQLNHSQSLHLLAERGGLSPGEAVFILEDRPLPWGDFPSKETAHARLVELVGADNVEWGMRW